MVTRLATATVSASLFGVQGRAVLSAKGHHFVADSPLALGGPNEEINPVDLLLSALASHAAFTCERYALQSGITLNALTVLITADFDPRGVTGQPVDPGLLAIRMRIQANGPSAEEGQQLVGAILARCTIYNTLRRAVPISIEVVLESASTPPATEE